MNANHATRLTVLLGALLLPFTALAAAEHDHGHGQQSPARSATIQSAPAAAAATSSARYDDLMQRMHDLHEKMMAARTPAGRQKLMTENMALMQEGMAMMKDMQSRTGPGMAMDSLGKAGAVSADQAGMREMDKCMDMHKLMMNRMNMMEMMMQMLMDQQSASMKK